MAQVAVEDLKVGQSFVTSKGTSYAVRSISVSSGKVYITTPKFASLQFKIGTLVTLRNDVSVKTKDAPPESPFARDTDAGSAMLVLADRNNGLNAKQIAAKYGFDIQFVLDVGNGKYGKTKAAIKKALEPVGDSDGIAFSVEDDKGRTLGGPYAARPKAESSLKELQQRLPKSKLKVVPVIAFGRGVQPVGDEFEEANHPRAKNGEFGKGGGRGMAEARKRFPESFKKPTKSFAELRREQAVAEGRADEPYETENSLANRRKKAKDEVQPVE